MALTKASAGVINIDDIYGFRNRVINGDMRINQRYTTSANTAIDGAYQLDRFWYQSSNAGKVTIQQMDNSNTSVANYESGCAPDGFTNSLKVTSTSAYSIQAGNYFSVNHFIEGNNIQGFDFGKSTAKNITLSFWVKSSITGTWSGCLQNGGPGAGSGGGSYRSYVFTYTINQANTWEYKTILVSGDTSGNWSYDNRQGLRILWCLAMNGYNTSNINIWQSGDYESYSSQTNSLVGTNGATWYLTGVQVESGSTATPFERRPYGFELELCKRYCEVLTFDYDKYTGASGFATTGGTTYFSLPFREKRLIPSITFNGYNYQGQGLNDTYSPTSIAATRISKTAVNLILYATYSSAGSVNGQAVCMRSLDNGQSIIISSEL